MLKTGGIGHITHHVIRLQFEGLPRGGGETPLEKSEALVHFMLAIGVAQRAKDAYGLVAGPDGPAWGRVAVEHGKLASYSADLAQARKSSRSVMPSACSKPSGLHRRASRVCSQHGRTSSGSVVIRRPPTDVLTRGSQEPTVARPLGHALPECRMDSWTSTSSARGARPIVGLGYFWVHPTGADYGRRGSVPVRVGGFLRSTQQQWSDLLDRFLEA